MIRWAGLAAGVLAASGALAAAASAPGPGLKFDKVFADAGEPGSMHYQATYESKGASHRIEIWRDGQRRLRRSTDGAIDTFVEREPGGAEYRMVILDAPHKIATRIDRSNLYRTGNFTDWFDLAHGLRHPKGDYQLARAPAPAGVIQPVAACSWFDLTQAAHAVHICWSARSRLPLLLVDASGAVVWRVTALDQQAIPASTFRIHDEGFVKNDANADMERD